ncbi:MAG: hypothetical protein NVS2B14_06030 [Chamaesiphon sp.]
MDNPNTTPLELLVSGIADNALALVLQNRYEEAGDYLSNCCRRMMHVGHAVMWVTMAVIKAEHYGHYVLFLQHLLGNDPEAIAKADADVEGAIAESRTQAIDRGLTYMVVIEKDESNFRAYAPDVPRCVVVGNTAEDAIANFKEALEFHLETLSKDDNPIPKSVSIHGYVDIDGSFTNGNNIQRLPFGF